MKAVGHRRVASIDEPGYLEDIEIEKPTPGAHDLLVRVKAVAVNPIDLKVYRRPPVEGRPSILGFDCAGVVEAVGADVDRFAIGEAVYYAGSVTRPGCNAQWHCVDERLVGHKPAQLAFSDAAAIALTGLTAYELLFDLMRIDDRDAAGQGVLVVGGSGGVASMAIQLIAALTERPIVATASRPDSAAWVRRLGAHYVIDHHADFAEQLDAAGAPPIGRVISMHTSETTWARIGRIITPFGRIGYIDDPHTLDIRVLKQKSVALYGEGMFNRSVFCTADMQRQHDILERIAELVEAGQLSSTAERHFGALSAENLTAAHRYLAAGHTTGKAVLDGIA
ncbi:zinc-binding alcohol dehydrogenase family protein [Salinisphaera sp. T31B1]|uniref:zinc-binding alcohol dehydrogenase family protein n=1 Tax=Salinisphaera sp. T31B1 TaxID=727963 RepID=UPI003342AC0C